MIATSAVAVWCLRLETLSSGTNDQNDWLALRPSQFHAWQSHGLFHLFMPWWLWGLHDRGLMSPIWALFSWNIAWFMLVLWVWTTGIGWIYDLQKWNWSPIYLFPIPLFYHDTGALYIIVRDVVKLIIMIYLSSCIFFPSDVIIQLILTVNCLHW